MEKSAGRGRDKYGIHVVRPVVPVDAHLGLPLEDSKRGAKHVELRSLHDTVSLVRSFLGRVSLPLTPSGAETLAFWAFQPLAWLVAPKDVPLMTRCGDLKLSHGAAAKARENAMKQDRVQTTNAIKSP